MKIGIITLHRVINYGSALQAYALQKHIEQEKLGEVELIDYVFPNKFHQKKRSFKEWLRHFYCVEIRDMYFRGRKKKIKKLREFGHDFFHLSERQYGTIQEIMDNPPIYDLYLTGSDQLWNVDTLRNDPVPYCEFAPIGSRRISYAASFTMNELPDEYKDSIRQRLNKYSHIGVRESSSLEIIKDLHINPNIVVRNTCDPTLLLEAKDYDRLSAESLIKIEGDYVLVYALQYAYKPDPALNTIVSRIREKTGCKIIVMDYYKVRIRKGDEIVEGLGPCEFCWLFSHAKFVVTSSFHGTMFSIINRKPFYVIAPPEGHHDHRITDVLDQLGLSGCYCHSNEIVDDLSITNPYTDDVEEKISKLVEDSKTYLYNAVNDVH